MANNIMMLVCSKCQTAGKWNCAKPGLFRLAKYYPPGGYINQDPEDAAFYTNMYEDSEKIDFVNRLEKFFQEHQHFDDIQNLMSGPTFLWLDYESRGDL